ncbi:molybdopterin molybdotransferase MoeA [Flavobacteriaceae bacterium AH-315-O20]|nr:molybdopterin molybdotransferase MoeA [Flavobacteriaceae bacterium AH-315-O20]
MITSEKALGIILNQTENFGEEAIDFKNSLGRVLKENIVADRDFPPFNCASMDGIAINIYAFKDGLRDFNIEGIQAAGNVQLTLQNNNNCIEVMTGAMTPLNTNVVIPYELVKIENNIAKISLNEVNYFQNIHKKGFDRKQNDVLIKKNTCISPAEIGVLATVGKSTIKVAKNPKVMVISTGDELVEVDQTPEDYQIRRSNAHTLVSLLKYLKINADSIHISDNKTVLKKKIAEILNNYDVLLFSGAVSKGKFDFLPEIFDELGVKKLFHKVRQRPGKPFWFGRHTVPLGISERNGEKATNTVVFAFPGNPVSTFVSCLKYFYPWYKKSIGISYKNNNFAVLAKDFTFKPDLTYFLQVKIANKNGTCYATPIAGHGSGDLANLVDNDAFIELPIGKEVFKKGEVFNLLLYRNF